MKEYAVDFEDDIGIIPGKLYSIHSPSGFSAFRAIRSEMDIWVDIGVVDLIVEFDE